MHNNVTMDGKVLHIVHAQQTASSNSTCVRGQQVSWRTSICAIKSLIGALAAARGNSGHEGKSMWISSSVNSRLMVLLMLLCCLLFGTKGHPPPIKNTCRYCLAGWLAAALYWCHMNRSLSQAAVVFIASELDRIRVAAVVCSVSKVISDRLFIRGREACNSSWNSLTASPTPSHTQIHPPPRAMESA